MKRLGFLALAVVVLIGSPALAQRQRPQRQGFGGFSGMTGDLTFLLGQKSVQDELKLAEDQTKKVTELAEKRRESFRDFRNLTPEERRKKFEERAKSAEKEVGEILKPEQLQRLKQIALQRRDGLAFSDPEVATALKLTDEQKEKIKTIREESGKSFRDLAQGGNREEARKKMDEMRKAHDEKLMGLLTDEQKAKWKELTGEPFKGEIRFGFARPGNGTRRPNKS